MFAAARDVSLDSCEWKGGKNGSLSLQYLEAWRYEGDVQASDVNFETGTLSSENELTAWLARPHKAPWRRGSAHPVGRIRLLVCDRTAYIPLDFALSRLAFELIETAFGLHPLTVPTFESGDGTHSRFLSYSDDECTRLDRIQTIMKVPQKREIMNWGLSTTYDADSRTTVGFLYGTGLQPHVYHTTHDRFKQCGNSPFGQFVESIKEAVRIWDHPMLLPCLFLSEHLACTNAFCMNGNILSETWQIEHALDVTRVGQAATYGRDPAHWKPPHGHTVDAKDLMRDRTGAGAEAPGMLSREATRLLTVRINTQSTRVVFTARSPEWNLACTRFMYKTLDEIWPYLPTSAKRGQQECKQLLEHNITLAEAIASNVGVIKDRMALQLNVLYNFIAQLDNQTNAELAASASRDSTSMKILAFISALFLPGSFISAMFSMNMIDWSGDGEKAVLSDKFWIYWVTALPLTILTILGWASWWYFEMGRFNNKIERIRTRKDGDVDGKRVGVGEVPVQGSVRV